MDKVVGGFVGTGGAPREVFCTRQGNCKAIDVQSNWSGHLANAGEVLILRRLIIEKREDISNV